MSTVDAGKGTAAVLRSSLGSAARLLLAPTAATSPRVLLVDDQAALRAAIAELLTEAGIAVVGEAASAGEVSILVPLAADAGRLVVLMDVRFPGDVNGIEATRRLVRCCPDLRVVIFTGFPDAGIEQAAYEAGAVGFLVKGCSAAEIVAAVRRAWDGDVAAADR
jgi:two-component system invasion response regulator UvrY